MPDRTAPDGGDMWRVWSFVFRLRALFIVALAAAAMTWPEVGPHHTALAAALLAVVLPYNTVVAAWSRRHGSLPAAMGIGDQLLCAAFYLAVPGVVVPAVVAAEFDLAVAAVVLTRSRALWAAAAGAAAFAAVPLAEAAAGERVATYSALGVVAYAVAAFVTVLIVGKLATRERDGQAQLRSLVESLGVVACEVDVATLQVTYLSSEVARLLGGDPQDYRGPQPLRDRVHPDDWTTVGTTIGSVGGGNLDLTFRMCTADGGERWVRALLRAVERRGQAVAVRGSLVDVSASKALEARLHHQATRDVLTGLDNRTGLLQAIERALQSMQHGTAKGRVGALFLDLDKIKRINDSLGHRIGDELLAAVGDRLKASVRGSDVAARLGGDEFAVVTVVTGERDLENLATRLLHVFDTPFVVDGYCLSVTTSIGGALADDGETTEELLAAADAAMYEAKRRGGGTFSLFTREVRARAVRHLELELELRDALAADQLRLAYQPIVEAGSRQVVGAEALLRWRHPALGDVSPAEFVPVAEVSNAILRIGRWAIDRACAQAAAWWAAGQPLSVSVNVSARQLADPVFAAHVRDALLRHQLAPERLCLELTETALVSDPAATRTVLATLSALGVRLALDDFGTGFSSLTHLLEFPVDIVKVDRSFIRGLGDSERCADIVAATVGLAATLGLTVVAEGVETAEQRDMLEAMGCTHLQGYLFGRPAPADELLVPQSRVVVPLQRQARSHAV